MLTAKVVGKLSWKDKRIILPTECLDLDKEYAYSTTLHIIEYLYDSGDEDVGIFDTKDLQNINPVLRMDRVMNTLFVFA